MSKRKIAYISQTVLLDCDLPLLYELSKNATVDYFLVVTSGSNQGTLVDMTLKEQGGIFCATEYPELKHLSRWLDLKHVFIVNKPVNHFWEWINFAIAWKGLQLFKKQNYDIIHLTWPLRYCSFVLYLLRKRMIITMHDPIPHSSQMSIKNRFERYWCIRLVPDFILLNKVQKALFMKEYGIRESRVHLSRLSIYTHLLESASTTSLCSDPYILFVGSIRSHKGIEYLCEAMEPITNDLPDMHVIIAGKGNFYYDISRYEKNPHYMFINRYITNEELVTLISNSIAVVCPYIDATQSGVIMSAFALNKPVIATNVGALPEMVEDGRYGFLVPPKDSKALEKAIRQIIKPGIAQQLSENIAHDYSAGNHAWHSIASEMQGIYETIIHKRRK